ncbi:coiled-coil domain-containing protein 138 isoform X3 [Artibeus jamaicensis]|uniref:coiled-coil domain-containing protein 138 isoform X3 n=1 Tax=Artibeus jamaicensis TaxID=9417 RepID=UPI00235B1BF8|nr:coiled-coil domain-containing protein 138 isoform X3 [Artibeus jamaicensis]
MEPRLVKPPGQDFAVERLKSRYGLGGFCSVEYAFSNFDQAKCKRRSLSSPVAWPSSNLASNSRNWTECCNDASYSPLKHVSSPTSKASNKQSLLPHQINQIYDELFQIHQKMQCETLAQQKFAEELKKREHFLVEREQLLFRHETALSKMKGMEEEVLTRFQIIKEQHDAEVVHLNEALKEKNRECKRLRSSFDTLKELNDYLKKQLNEISEENRKMEIQAKRVQARLGNLQRKYEFMTMQRLKGNSHAAHEIKSLIQKVPVSKTCKVPLNAQVYELLTIFMDWISDYYLSKLKSEGSEMGSESPVLKFASQRNDIQENCVKHSTMTSTLRRLGEVVFKGVVTKGIQDNSSEHSMDNKPKIASFFRSSNLPLRFLSTLIVLKTVTQADYLAQAFDSLCLDLKTDEGKVLFLQYQAVPVILNHLRISSKGLLSNVIDSLLQMTVESTPISAPGLGTVFLAYSPTPLPPVLKHALHALTSKLRIESLQPFLEACSNNLFFRTCSVLLRTPKLDLQILEKLSIILQKLSKIKSNKKFFELFTIHLMLQEIQRTTHPEHAFLCINLNSTLFNLGLMKCNSLASNGSH